MLNFFRKIRKNILSVGNTRKYFKYALGEILLVVIGILIALQINNWNENRKFKIVEITKLTKLVEELVLDSINIEVNLKTCHEIETLHTQLFNIGYKGLEDPITVNPSSIRKYMFYNPNSINISKVFVNELSNTVVREQLIHYNTQLEYTSVVNDEFIDIIKSIRAFLGEQEAYNLPSVLETSAGHLNFAQLLLTEETLTRLAKRKDFQQLLFEANLKLKYLCSGLTTIATENIILKDLIIKELNSNY